MIFSRLVTNFDQLIAAAGDSNIHHVILASATSPNYSTISRGFLAEAAAYGHEKQLRVDAFISAPNDKAFIFNDHEIKLMEADVFAAQSLGIDGVILNAINPNNQLDISSLEQLSSAAGGMEVSLGWSIDELPESKQAEAFKWAAENNIEHIYSRRLSSQLLDSDKNKMIVPVLKSKDDLSATKANFNQILIG